MFLIEGKRSERFRFQLMVLGFTRGEFESMTNVVGDPFLFGASKGNLWVDRDF
uniref:Uncharacterized protein n=1 Tax=Meloidogyne incognita TaxID=6306 RepID=A0A914KQC2_MELIC